MTLSPTSSVDQDLRKTAQVMAPDAAMMDAATRIARTFLEIRRSALAGSEIAPLQAFRFGSRAYGLLFHLEIETEGIDALCRECATDLDRARLAASNVSIGFLPHMWLSHQMADQLIGQLLTPKR